MISLVLSGGGLKGLAHIGVLRALEERGYIPSTVIGVSMGSLIAAGWAGGRSVHELEDYALGLERKDVFRIAHTDMAFKRMRAPAVYRREPLDRILADLIGPVTFRELPRRLLVNTVDLHTGRQILWGLPGLTDVSVADAVFASCALPGILPPRFVGGHLCADGAVVENLPVQAAAAVGAQVIVAVDLTRGDEARPGIERHGFAMTYSRGLEIVMGRMVEHSLAEWDYPPLVLIRPYIGRVGMFTFNRTPFLIAEGYRATMEVLDQLPPFDDLEPGIHPKREVEVRIARELCVGCGLCAARYPAIFQMDARGKATVRTPRHLWSPLGDAAVRTCPTSAITAEETPGTSHPVPD